MPNTMKVGIRNITILLAITLLTTCSPPAPTATEQPEPISTPTNTSTPTFEATIIPDPTWTPLPTLSADEAIALAEELYATNAGCRLPCWWGIMPGVTTWEETRQFYETFATEIIQNKSIQITERGVTYTATRYIVRFALGGDYHVNGQSIYVIDGVVSTIDFGRLTLEYTIGLHQMLEEYGMPTQIFLWTVADGPFRPLPFTLILLYEDQGILGKYTYDNAERLEDIIQSCPKPVGTILWLWSQIIEMDFHDIEFIAVSEDPPYPLGLLEDVTDYTVESFHQTFKDPSNETCIETPVKHWE